MSKNETVTGKVTAIKLHGHTIYGNPIVSIQLDHDSQWYRISDNAGLVYGIENREYREHAHAFKLTKAGRISGVVVPVSFKR